jgi:radical SAM superfamily enzyme YgiQ (UPF0313 family)
MLLFPPNWTPTMPHLALPTLTAYLRANGVEVIQRDLNIEVFDAVLSQEYLKKTLNRLRQMYARRGELRPGQEARRVPPPQTVQWALNHGPDLIRHVENAKAVIRSDSFFDGPVGLKAIQTLAQSLEIISLPFYPASLHLQSYEPALPADSSRNLLNLSKNRQYNMLIDLYEAMVMADIEREKPDVVGISIPSLAQMLPGLTLGAMIKARGLKSHITIGGPHISMLREALCQVPQIFQLFDSAIIFDGEVPLLRLAEAVTGQGDIAQVPNLIYNDGGTIRVNDRKEPEKISDLPLPDFEGFPLDRYLAPKLVLPLLTARGCYFGKCAFCNVGYGEAETFSQLRAENLADQMQALHQTYGTKHIFFADEAITPRNLRDLKPALAKRGDPVHWGGCVRFEKVISKELLQGAYDAGCRMILFGLETASEAIVERMIKGTQLPHMHRILEESTEVGIWNHTFFFFGFPGETLEDAQETVNFLYRHKYHINSAAMGTFLLERYAPAHRFPKTFGITRVIEDPDRDLAIYFDYEVESGLDERTADMLADRFLNTLPTKKYAQFYIHDVYRFLYSSYLSQRDQPLPPWLVPEEQWQQEVAA